MSLQQIKIVGSHLFDKFKELSQIIGVFSILKYAVDGQGMVSLRMLLLIGVIATGIFTFFGGLAKIVQNDPPEEGRVSTGP